MRLRFHLIKFCRYVCNLGDEYSMLTVRPVLEGFFRHVRIDRCIRYI